MLRWLRKRKQAPLPPTEPPIPYNDVRALFEWLDKPNPPPCDNTHRQTIEFLKARELPIESTIAWLEANGGFCDCEVIFNVTNDWSDKVGWQPAEET